MKKPAQHSTTLLAILFLLVATTVSAQSGWSEPEAFTTETADHTNPWLGYVKDLGYILLYERSTDTATTALYYQYYLTTEEPVLLLEEQGVRFKNPEVWNLPQSGDTTFLVIFERQHNGETDIQYIKCAPDGGHSGPVTLADQGTHNYGYTLSKLAYLDQIAWISDDIILVAQRQWNGGFTGFSDPDTLDSGDVSSPNLGSFWPTLYWIKSGDTEDQIFFATMDGNYNWSQPEMLIAETEISCMKKSAQEVYELLVFSYKENETWKINNMFPGYPPTFEPLDITNTEPYDFGVFATGIPVDESNTLELYSLAYPKDTLGGREIMMFDYTWWPNHFQLSSLGTESRHPDFFQADSPNFYSYWVYLVWEAFVDGNWQLYYSRKLYYWGSVDENLRSQDIMVYPNPATDFIMVENKKNQDLTFRLFNATGKQVYSGRMKNAEMQIDVSHLATGIYLLKLQNGKSRYTRKILID